MSFIVRLLNGSTHCDLLQQGVLINYTHGADCATISNKNWQKHTQKPHYDQRESQQSVELPYLFRLTNIIDHLP